MYKFLAGAVQLAQLLLTPVIKPGGRVVDATAGNGFDTLFLARLVGPRGQVYSFDLQEEALTVTGALLLQEGCREQVEIIHADHAGMDRYVTEPVHAIMFNLGYLPGGSHHFTTVAEKTVEALRQAVGLLLPGGAVTVVAYPGHPGGREEMDAVAAFLEGLKAREFRTARLEFTNRNDAPCLFLLEKKGLTGE